MSIETRVGRFYKIRTKHITCTKESNLFYVLPYDATSESEKKPSNEIDKSLVVYRFSG